MKITRKTIILTLLVIVLGVAFYPPPATAPIVYIERKTGIIKKEKVPGEKWLIWLYNNPFGELTLQTLVKRKFVSSLYGKLMDRPGSVDKIGPFVQDYGIDLSIVQKQAFHSFNDFFIRELRKDARKINIDSLVIISPGDGKILAYEDVDQQDFIIKGSRFNVGEFLGDTILSGKYKDGSLIILRLSPADYHRFHFPVSGKVSPVKKINGDYFSVSPIALRKKIKIFCLNKREYVTISTGNTGDVIMAEVGATMVGSIIQTYSGNTAIKGAEKGYFKFGGSSVVLLFEKGEIKIDEDLLRNTKSHLETGVIMGERIAKSIQDIPVLQ